MPLNMANSVSSMASGLLGLRGDSSRFIVVFDSGKYDLGSWSKVSGLTVSSDPIEYRVGDTNQIWSVPGITKYNKISLSRATTIDSGVVQQWLAETAKKPQVYSGCIQLHSSLGIPICEWVLKAFVPCGWKIADMESKASTIVMETLDLAHRGFLPDDLKLGGPGGGLL
jgi:phage tail-like protein